MRQFPVGWKKRKKQKKSCGQGMSDVGGASGAPWPMRSKETSSDSQFLHPRSKTAGSQKHLTQYA